jgi:NitT/TauT family transport system substrate-binding protein
MIIEVIPISCDIAIFFQHKELNMKLEKIEIARFLVLVILTSFAFLLASCNKQKEQSVDAKSADGKKELTQLRVSFSPTSPITLLCYLALDQGYYEEEGLDVVSTPVSTGANIDAFTALLTGKLDLITGGGGIGILLSFELDHPTVVIGGVMSGQGGLLIRPGDEAKWQQLDNASLAGKKIGTKRTSSSDITFRGVLLENGVDLSKVSFVELDSASSAVMACVKGEVDAAVVGHSELYNAEKLGLKIYKLVGEWMPDVPCCRIVATTDLIKKYRKEYIGFLKSNIRAYKLLITDRAKALEIGTRRLGMDEDRISKFVYDYGYLSLTPDPGTERIQKFYDVGNKIGYLSKQIDLGPHIDTSLYEEALDEILREYPNDPFYQKLKQEFINYNGLVQ